LLVESLSENISEADKESLLTNPYGDSPLGAAAEKGHLEVVEYLVEQGLNPNNRDGFKHAPIQRAAFEGHLEVVEYLVEKARVDPKELTKSLRDSDVAADVQPVGVGSSEICDRLCNLLMQIEASTYESQVALAQSVLSHKMGETLKRDLKV